jgi:hypothetical protein
MSTWFPLHQHSDASLLDGLPKPQHIAARAVECGYAGSALTDHGSVSNCPGLIDALATVCAGCGRPISGGESLATLVGYPGDWHPECLKSAAGLDREMRVPATGRKEKRK